MSLAPGTKLDRYEIMTAIGAGGMGEVYRARDPRLSRDVAVKVMSAELAKDPASAIRTGSAVDGLPFPPQYSRGP